MTPVFILSLPRSRTAWLATFFCYGESYAFHEGLLRCKSPNDLKTLFEATGKDVVVNSDCGNILFLEQIQQLFPNAKYIVVERDYSEVSNELMEIGLPDTGIVRLSVDLLEQAKRQLNPMVVQYDRLDKETCRAMCDYIGVSFDELRWEMLDGLDIRIIVDKKVENVKGTELEVSKWLG